MLLFSLFHMIFFTLKYLMLNIKNIQTESSVRQLAQQLNCSLTEAVRIAVEEKLRQLAAEQGDYIDQVKAAARRVTAVFPPDEFLTDDDLYDDNGLPR